MAYRYQQSSYCEAEREEEYSSFSSGMSSMDNHGGRHQAHHNYGLGSGGCADQIDISSYNYQSNYGGPGYHHGMNSNNYHAGGGMASDYARREEESFYESNNNYNPCGRFL